MATATGTVIPQVKVEHADANIKDEAMDVDMPSPYVDEDEDGFEDAGDLDFSQAQQQMWLSHLPRSLWQALSKLEDDEEIDLGTIRVEGPENDPQRIILRLNPLPELEDQHKEFDLLPPPKEKVKSHRPGQALIFSEKDLPGYKSKSFVWDNDDDENAGQGRSKLYDDAKRKARNKERKESKEPQQYRRRAIPKKTAIAGVIAKEFDAVPVKNAEYAEVERRKMARLLSRQAPAEATQILSPEQDPTRRQNITSILQRQRDNRAAAAKRQAVKDNRTARMDKQDLVVLLLQKFRQHRIWGLRDLKVALQQPEQYLRETLQEIAHMHKQGDFNGKWELNEQYKENDDSLQNPESLEAPKMEDSEMDVSGMEDDDDEDEKFEDV
ncbi:uncharacterized protein HMPREF1541_08877 [Cyphellophora europaea CBS 101466]|uniref:Transcription initiation factor IIF subunit beta n=1 Tax=Cyphellophora europaea (strain CBS 101466) TaxID=1220924 RepID=W2RLJ1_CYPE1|nr:uncharacterized protein HMPREF1541_08877 [Cyphellophora europaea CBS 101466]ETN36599.1 hypothetical protein HMPREF1541_08877 [Cyphellophora europaea CBS 101466]